MISDGERMKQIAERLGISPKEIAQRLNRHDNTIYNWYSQTHLKTDIIKDFYSEIANIELWQFFAPDDLVLTGLSPEEQEVIRLFNLFPEPVKELFVDVNLHISELLKKALETARKSK